MAVSLNVELNSDSVQLLITGGSATLGGDLVVSDASLQARASGRGVPVL